MTDYNHKSDFSADGIISSSVQGKLIGTTQVMPTPSAELEGTTVQYIGPAAGSAYIPGYIYLCQEETAGSGTYIWKANNPGSSSLDVDTSMSDDSTHPVQNKVIKEYVDTGLGTKENTLTGAKLDAVDSGITSTKVSAYDTHVSTTGNPHGTTAADVGAVPTSRKVNGHELSTDVTVTASDVGLDKVANTEDSATPEENGTKKFTTGGAYTELKKKVDASTATTNGKSVISNVAGESGAVIYWLANDNQTKSALAVNDSDVGGPSAQIYAINPSLTNKGSKLNIRTTGIYYLKDKATPATEDANDEIATIGDLAAKVDIYKNTSTTTNMVYGAAKNTEVVTMYNIAASSTDSGLAQMDVVTNYVDNKFLTKDSVINDCTHTDTDKPLAANQGKVLMDKIDNISSLGRYLSTWDCTTGLPGDNPGTLPYTYEAGDYYVISRVKDGTTTTKNYMPTGTSYTGAASTTEDTTADIKVNYIYKYSGATATVQWQLIKSEAKTTTFSTIGGAPRDNTNLAAELDKKLDVLADASTGQPMRMPYYFEILPEAGKIVVKDYTVQMNNTQTKETFTLEVPAAVLTATTELPNGQAGLYTKAIHDTLTAADSANASAITSEATRAKAAEQTNATAISTEASRAAGVESKKLDILTDASAGQPMRMPYFFEIKPEAEKIVVKDYTVQMNNTQTKEVFTLDVPAMDGTNAGLYTASLANAKVSTTDYITEADINALVWS